jgi:hypothetical protein
MTDAAFNSWVERARSTPIERVIEQRGIRLNGKTDRNGPCPVCGGDDRFAINVRKQVFNCRQCGVGGDVIKMVEHLDGVDFIAACTTLAGAPPKLNGKAAAKPRKIIAATFTYQNADGTTAFAIDRIEWVGWDGSRILKGGKVKKAFTQKRPDPDRPGEWVFNVDGIAPVPYRLPEVTEAIANGSVVLIAEGERKVDHLWALNIPATCNAAGAGKWKPEHSEYLRGADVVLVPDNDNAGFEHIHKIGASLSGVSRRTGVLILPDLPVKGDVVDWVRNGGTREQLLELIEQAPDWQPMTATEKPDDTTTTAEKVAAKAKEDAILEALSHLPRGVEFDRQRQQAAKELGVSRRAIDDELEERRGEQVASPLFGHWAVEPWPEPVEGDSLLRDIIRRIRRHVVCSPDDALTIALWVLFSWVHDTVATHSPILNINSAEPESGKSTTLGLLAFLLPRCISSVAISEAALYRSIKLWQPSFAIDEFDSVLANDDAAGMRSVINSGHLRGQGVLRCVGDDKTPEHFPTFTPKALGMIGRKLPPATLSRCIFVELRRKKRDEPITRFEHKDDAELADLRRRLLRWSMDNDKTLRTAMASVAIPAALENRRADNWRLQFCIADLAGEDWGDQARSAALKIEGKADSRTIGARLLADIKALFDADLKTHCLHSSFIVASLIEDQEKPWVEFTRGKPLTQGRLARMLGIYSITSQTVAPPGLKDGKGYYKSQFEDAWLRYLPAAPTDENLNFG